MSKSVYVVNNMEQEGNVLKALIESGYKHPHTEKYKYSFVPSINGSAFDGFPYEIIADKEEHNIYWRTIPKQMVNVSQLNKPDELIIYDGREENDKMKISKEVYDALIEWKYTLDSNDDEYKPLVSWVNIKNLPETVYMWLGDDVPDKENNNRLIAIIRWVNGEDVFEVEKSKKWVVISKSHDAQYNGVYIKIEGENCIKYPAPCERKEATRFDTKEEAESWANSHQEVIGVK